MTLAAILERRRIGYPHHDASPPSPSSESTRGQPTSPPLLIVPAVPSVPTEEDDVDSPFPQLAGIARAVVRFQLAGCPANTWAIATGAKTRDEVIVELRTKWPSAKVLPA